LSNLPQVFRINPETCGRQFRIKSTGSHFILK
jgi:hypothetical protein